MYILYNCLLSIPRTTWRWPLSSAETYSCTLCRKCTVVLDEYTHSKLVTQQYIQ